MINAMKIKVSSSSSISGILPQVFFPHSLSVERPLQVCSFTLSDSISGRQEDLVKSPQIYPTITY